jgi:hypothetical protein
MKNQSTGRLRPAFVPFVLRASLIAALACGPAEPPAATAVIRDSAGITIVENSAPASHRVDIWRLSASPVVEIGALEDEPSHQFTEVASALRMSDGRIVVGDRGTRELRFFDREGGHVLTVGGSGQGPGEFRRLNAIDRIRGDTLVASEWPVGTLAWFDPHGSYIKNTRLGPYWPGLAGRTLYDGSLLVDVYPVGGYGGEVEVWAASGQDQSFRPTGWIVRVSRDGEAADTLHTIEGEEFFKVGRIRAGLALRAKPFARSGAVTWSRDRIYLGDTGRPEVEVLWLNGSLERLIRWEEEPVSVTGGDRDEFRESVLGSLRRPNQRPDYERWLAEVPFPVHKPSFQELATDVAGRLWVRLSTAGEADHNRWLVFDPEGQLVAEVEMPAGYRLLDIAEGHVLAMWKDDLDVEYVRLYRLLK